MNSDSHITKQETKKTLFTIIGMGKFGTALAHVINKSIDTRHACLRTYDPSSADSPSFCHFSTDISNACFANEPYPENVGKHWIVTAVPAAQVINVLKQVEKFRLTNPSVLLVSKGVCSEGLFLSQSIEQHFGQKYAIAALAGPHFAKGLLEDSDVITSIGCHESDISSLKQAFDGINPHYCSSSGALGVQIVSVMKNMSAFCCGLASGLGLPENTVATVFSLCMEEIKSLLAHFKCDTELTSNAALLADLVLCCTSSTSRNYKAGQDTALGTVGSGELVESVKSINAMYGKLQGSLAVPFLELVYNSIYESKTTDDLKMHMKKALTAGIKTYRN